MEAARETLAKFDINNLPNLDTVVLGALELFSEESTNFQLSSFSRSLVVGSAGSLGAGRMMFANKDVVFADESTYKQVLGTTAGIDGVILVSASGGKHAISAAKYFQEKGISTVLMTNNLEAPAAEFIEPSLVFVFPKNREPYTYNTSTYLGMILSQTGESAAFIKSYIENYVDQALVKNFADYNAFVFIVPSQLSHVTTMIRIKFEEMFMPLVVGRAYTDEEIKHAKSVVQSDKELFISLSVENKYFGKEENRMFIPLPPDADYGAVMAIAYYVVGKIQAMQPPYFKDSLVPLTTKMSEVFGTTINPIVE